MKQLWDVPKFMTLYVGLMEILIPMNAGYVLKIGNARFLSSFKNMGLAEGFEIY